MAIFNAGLLTLAAQLALLSAGMFVLGMVVLGIMNAWGILDPRMGQAVKGGLVRLCLSVLMIAAGVAGGSAFVGLLNGGGGAG